MDRTPAQTLAADGAFGKTREFLGMIKWEHTVFALPFAYMTLFLVEGGWPRGPLFGWITLAMIMGRTFGMAANRLIDARIDSRNPRTVSRSLPAGRLGTWEVAFFMVVSLAVFLLAVYRLSPLAQKLWPVVVVAMVFYPYAKRFTWLCHLALGFVYVMIPTGVWIAATGEMPIAAVVLGIGAGLWVAGFDIIYSCQDVAVDRREGLHSMPADLGVSPSLWAARVFHAIYFACLLVAGWMLDVGVVYYMGAAVAGLLLAYEHRVVTPNRVGNINLAFFTTNGVISVILFVLVAADAVLRP